MIIKNSYLLNFRNFDNLNIQFDKKTNIIVGDNAQGKTNILEAVYFSAKGKSFRPSKEVDLIKFDKENSYIRVDIESDEVSEIIEVKLSRDKKKQIRINEDLIDTMKELRTFFDIVTFTPEDIKIIKDSKSYRRNFIDEVITGLIPSYNKVLVKYNNILDQRNYLLKYGKNKKYFNEQLKAVTKQLVTEGIIVIKMRNKYATSLNKLSKIIHSEITERKENISIEYDNTILKKYGEDLEKNLYLETMKNIEKDKEMGFTTIGCHRDDIVINIDGRNSRVFASQGQQRTLTISLKLAQIKIYEKLKETKPIILLDDVFSELDTSRIKYLLNVINDYQSIITSTNFDFIDDIKELDFRIFMLKDKNIRIIK
ncbi:DNA replication/repair protein RecF [Miniphocaeibacter massiliensis]|uniref:DNA replication/repair protein RecF n=1 Tax=Miniphocaeibacter massiliensis TaxID=2041841 RepID=UPI000C1BF179|nr:DNA replication/repair protein RecF [Miniphocaeibacter massiliensis]